MVGILEECDEVLIPLGAIRYAQAWFLGTWWHNPVYVFLKSHQFFQNYILLDANTVQLIQFFFVSLLN